MLYSFEAKMDDHHTSLPKAHELHYTKIFILGEIA